MLKKKKKKEKVAAVKRFIDFNLGRWRFSLVALTAEVWGRAIYKNEEGREICVYKKRQMEKKKERHEDKTYLSQGFPGGAVVKNPPTNAGDTGSSPGPGRSHMPRSN